MRLILTIVLALTLSACDKIYINPSSPTDVVDSGGRGSSVGTKVEYRVQGNASAVRIRYSNPVDGLNQVITTPPWTASFTTNETQMFLTIEAVPITYPSLTYFPFLSVQVFVNGTLFRSAESNDYTATTISASGNWRK